MQRAGLEANAFIRLLVLAISSSLRCACSGMLILETCLRPAPLRIAAEDFMLGRGAATSLDSVVVVPVAMSDRLLDEG